MSATIDADRVAAFLDDCPVVRVAGRHVSRRRRPTRRSTSVADAAVELMRDVDGQRALLSAGRVRDSNDDRSTTPRRVAGIEMLPLHGSLDAAAAGPCAASAAAGTRRIIVATNIAETSVTVPGVTAVVDAGLQKVARYDAARAIDSLTTERITAGRGRSARGPCRPHRARTRPSSVGPARPPAAASRARYPPGRSVGDGARHPWRGAAIRARSSGSRRRAPTRSMRPLALLERLDAVVIAAA